MPKQTLTKFILIFFTISIISVSSFGIVEKLSIEEKIKRANTIVMGTVLFTQSQWEEVNGGGRIFTYVYIDVEQYIKGFGGSLIEIKAPGGKVGEITQWVSDTPQFIEGEKVIVFLRPEFFQVVGWHQGKYTVKDDKVVGLGVEASKFVNMIHKIDIELDFGPLDALPTQINQSEEQLESKKTLGSGEPGSGVLNKAILKSDGAKTKDKPEKKISYIPVPVSYDIILRKTTGPNLTPYKPGGWADKIVISNHPGDNDDSPLDFTDTLYVDWAVINNGAAATEDTFYTHLYVDEILKATWYTNHPMEPGWYAYVSDFSIGSLSPGSHTIKIVAYTENQTTETNESDNEYQRTINIAAASPQISSISPSIASAGTDTTVTINGSDFGATKGSSKVEFFYRSGQPKIEAPIVSWSDTQIQCKIPTDIVIGYPASSGSGPVTVTTSLGTSNGHTFKVTFGYGGAKWPGAHPNVNYEINENTSDCTGEGGAVIAAANGWNNQGARFTYVYDGSTSATEYSLNGHNEIMWGSTGGSIATNHFWYIGEDLLEFDIVFEDSFTWSTTGSAGTYDVQNIATHELGHSLSLWDIYGDIGDGEYDTAKTMYGFGSTGETKKSTLHSDDIDGILWIYGTECTPPSITAQPQSQIINYETSATLSVTATGTPPLTYQWYQGTSGDTSTPVGTNSSSYTTPNLTATTSYWVRVSDGCGSVDSDTAAITVNPPVGPEINIKYDTTDIPDGGSCDFGSQEVGTPTDVSFTIENPGTEDLTLSGSPIIVITGTDADQFSVQQQPTSPVASGASTTFIIRFSPTSEGLKSGSISIANNDANENPYDITLEGTGLVPTGSLRVTIEPQGARDAGAQWKRLCTTTWYDSGYTESGIPEGDVIVEFKDIAGWIKPANQIVTITDGTITEVTATYTQVGGPGIFIDSGQALGSSNSYTVALGDVDGDGDIDAFVANWGEANKVWLNDGNGTFTDSGQSLGSADSRDMALGDLDCDGDLDAVVVNFGANKVWLNDGNGTFTDSGQNLGSAFSLGVVLGDVDGDGDLDVFIANFDQPNKVWLNGGNGTFTDSGQNLSSAISLGVVLGDVDGDGDLDAFVANANQANKVWLNDGSGTFTDSGQSLGSAASYYVALGDVEGDGDLDSFVANHGANKVWLNNGSGTFTDSGQHLGSAFSKDVALGDVDGDADLDAFLANLNYNKVWLNDGTGIFSDSGQSLGISDSHVVALGDVDGDGDIDAFVANYNQPNKVWLNECTSPTITTQPQSQIIDYNTSAALSVTATGTPPLSYQWYQGTSGDTSTPVGTNSSSYTTPNLTATTSYWVRVSNGCGSVDSDTAAICILLEMPTNPSPEDTATGVLLYADLDWDDSIGATSYDVYLGTTSPPPFLETVTSSAYDPGTLNPSTTYYWKIVSKNDCEETEGPEWHFTTCTLPDAPSNLSPADGTTGVLLYTTLDWDDSIGATSYDVYFGTTSPPPFLETVTSSAYDPGTLNPSTTYYWKIAAKNNCGETKGPEWHFATQLPPTPKAWTFMVYLDGDNDLERDGIDDFLEMASVGSGANINIVVQFDRISGEDSSYGDWTSTKRFYVTNGMTPTAENALQDLGELNHGDPQTLIDFVNWTKVIFPANNYALILWNHGSAWHKSKEELQQEIPEGEKELIFKAVCWDDTDGEDKLYMDEVQSALASTGGAQLIGFDACLLGMVEVAYEIKGHGEVMVGSEEIEPADGWPYDTILQDLTDNPTWSSSELATAIVNRYDESYENNFTQSAIDLSKMDTLANTINSFAQAMIDYWNSDQDAVKNAAQAVNIEIENTVIHEQHGLLLLSAKGLAIYFPETLDDFSSDYNETIIDFPNDTQWDEFLQVFYSSMGGSWIKEKRVPSQQFEYPEHIDLYHFCKLINTEPGYYYAGSQIPHEYIGGGTTQNVRDDDAVITYSLPFDFPYFDEIIPTGTDIYISTNGFIDFVVQSLDWTNTTCELFSNKRIAPCWTDLRTNGSVQAEEDIYITTNSDNLVIRWVAEIGLSTEPVNIELILSDNGRIQFNYDGGNANLSHWYTEKGPTIGISNGDGINFSLSAYNGQTALTNVESLLFAVQRDLTITIDPSEGGATNPQSGSYSYDYGQQVTITPSPNTYYRFDRWTGDVPTGHERDETLTITMDSYKSIKANFVKILAPLNFALKQEFNRSLLISEYINILTWEADPNNTNITKYRIYLVKNGTRELLVKLNVDTFEHWHRNVEKDKTYTYALVAVHEGGREGEPAYTTIQGGGAQKTADTQVAITAIPQSENRFSERSPDKSKTDIPRAIIVDPDELLTAKFIRNIYPPLSFIGKKVVNSTLPEIEYINVSAWQPNPENQNIEKYKIYQIEGKIKRLLAELNADTFEYKHRNVEKDKQYIYAICAVNDENREGEFVYVEIN